MSDEEEGKHIFVHLVAVEDWRKANEATIPEKANKHLNEVLDYSWKDEMKHYQEGLLTDEDLELTDEQTIEHARKAGEA